MHIYIVNLFVALFFLTSFSTRSVNANSYHDNAPAPRGAEYQIGLEPTWVVVLEYEEPEMLPHEQISQGRYFLLSDTQVRVSQDTLERYRHIALKIVSELGVQKESQVSVNYDPSFQSLTLHNVSIHRGSQVIDQLHPSAISLLQREPNLEAQIYDGSKTANIILRDVRIGDIVEYSYTVHGNNPTFEGAYYDQFYTQWGVPIHSLRYRLLWPSSRNLYLHPQSTEIQPAITEHEDVTEYLWSMDSIPVLQVDEHLPIWYNPYPRVQLSEAASWTAVARWGTRLFYGQQHPSSLVDLQVQAIEKAHKKLADRLVAALRFVQDDIRYMSISMGRGSYEPQTPEQVMRQRFGDCKDKALLFVTMLEELGIDAQPALVHTEDRHTIADGHPSPLAFDHVIVRVELEEAVYWLDPTRLYQRGTLEQLVQADFGRALVLDERTTQLSSIPAPTHEAPDKQIVETFDLSQGFDKAVAFTVETTFRGGGADNVRSYVAGLSPDELRQRYLSYYTDEYPSITIDVPLEIKDDSLANVLVITEHYLITEAKASNEQAGSSTFTYRPLETESLLGLPSQIERSSPFYTSPPWYQVQQARFLLPEAWSVEEGKEHMEGPASSFEYDVTFGNDVVTINYIYRNLVDHVNPEDLEEHHAFVEHTNDLLGYQFYDPSDFGGAEGLNGLLILLTIGALAFAVGGALKLYRYEPVASSSVTLDSDYAGIRGWLLLVALGLVVTLLRLLGETSDLFPLFQASIWASLTTPGAETYHPLWGPVLLFELFAHVMMLVAVILMAILFFTKRRTFPRFYIVYLVGMLLIQVLDSALASALPDTEVTAAEVTELVRQALSSLVWIAYFRVSKRVKNTFVETGPGYPAREPEPPEQKAYLPYQSSAAST